MALATSYILMEGHDIIYLASDTRKYQIIDKLTGEKENTPVSFDIKMILNIKK